MFNRTYGLHDMVMTILGLKINIPGMTLQLRHLPHHIGRKRILSVDVLRGLAMVFVIMQHAYFSVNSRSIPFLIDFLLWKMTGIAAVAFLSISGVIYSYYLYLQTDWRLSYRRYVKRAAFLLLAVHPIINLASYYFIVAGKSHSSGFQTFIYIFLFNFPMTDTIAACLLISPVFIIRFSHFQRTMAIVSILL